MYDGANPAARLHRDVRVYRIFEGATEALVDFLGARTLARPERVAALTAGTETAACLHEAVETAPATDQDRQRARTGRALMWSLALAAVRSRPSSGRPDAPRHRPPSGRAPGYPAASQHPDELAATVAAYGERIGDVEPSLPGGWTAADPLLRSELPAG